MIESKRSTANGKFEHFKKASGPDSLGCRFGATTSTLLICLLQWSGDLWDRGMLNRTLHDWLVGIMLILFITSTEVTNSQSLLNLYLVNGIIGASIFAALAGLR